MDRSAKAICGGWNGSSIEQGRGRDATRNIGRKFARVAYQAAATLPERAARRGGEHGIQSGRHRCRAALSLPNFDVMKIVDPREQQVGICAACKKPITHPGPDGECMRCLVSFGFLAEDHEAGGTRNRPGPLHYAHFEVEIDDNGFPVILGAGAMAVTYHARDTILNSTVALKVIGRKLAENPTARARFLREARAAAKIHHPNVARVSHYGEQDGECFYAMELVEGETLEMRVQRDGPLPLPLALEVIQQTARGLAAAEACGVV